MGNEKCIGENWCIVSERQTTRSGRPIKGSRRLRRFEGGELCLKLRDLLVGSLADIVTHTNEKKQQLDGTSSSALSSAGDLSATKTAALVAPSADLLVGSMVTLT